MANRFSRHITNVKKSLQEFATGQYQKFNTNDEGDTLADQMHMYIHKTKPDERYFCLTDSVKSINGIKPDLDGSINDTHNVETIDGYFWLQDEVTLIGYMRNDQTGIYKVAEKYGDVQFEQFEEYQEEYNRTQFTIIFSSPITILDRQEFFFENIETGIKYYVSFRTLWYSQFYNFKNSTETKLANLQSTVSSLENTLNVLLPEFNNVQTRVDELTIVINASTTLWTPNNLISEQYGQRKINISAVVSNLIWGVEQTHYGWLVRSGSGQAYDFFVVENGNKTIRTARWNSAGYFNQYSFVNSPEIIQGVYQMITTDSNPTNANLKENETTAVYCNTIFFNALIGQEIEGVGTMARKGDRYYLQLYIGTGNYQVTFTYENGTYSDINRYDSSVQYPPITQTNEEEIIKDDGIEDSEQIEVDKQEMG